MTRVAHGLMLPWLVAPFFLASGNVVPAVPQAGIKAALPPEAILAVLPHLDLGSLYETLAVSHDFHWLALETIKSLYGTRRGEKVVLNYSQILKEREVLVRDLDLAGIALQDSLEYQCLQFLLEAEFGYCIKHPTGYLPFFYLPDDSFDILNDENKVSVLPYVLDHDMGSARWMDYLRGLVGLERLDLLKQITFSNISSSWFYNRLNVTAVPECIFLTAARSLQKIEPRLVLSKLLALLEHGELLVEFPEKYQLPLCLFKRLHEKKIPVPEGYELIQWSHEASSLEFWMYVFSKTGEEARVLQDLVREHGDVDSRIMLRTFTELVPLRDVRPFSRAEYMAMLVRIHFSPVCNAYIAEDYKNMLEGLTKIGYQTACAFLDCKQYSLLNQYGFQRFTTIALEALIDRMHRLNEPDLEPYMAKCLQCYEEAPKLLKRLVLRKAAPSYVQLVKKSLESTVCSQSIDYQCCLAPLDVLQRLAYGQYASLEDIETMFGMLHGFQWKEKAVSRELHVLYTVMFWELPETVIQHFLDLVPTGCKLGYQRVLGLLKVKKYSSKLLAMIVPRCEGLDFFMALDIEIFRPDVGEVLKGWLEAIERSKAK